MSKLGHRLPALLAAMLAVAGLTSAPTAFASTSTVARPATVTTVCSNWAVPTGDVITAINASSPTCSPYSQYTVQPPTNGVKVCYNSPIPVPYVATALVTTTICAGLDLSTLNQAQNGMLICSTSTIPNGFVFDRVDPSNGSCRTLGEYHLVTAAAGVAQCSWSPQSTGFVVSSISQSSNNACGTAGYYYLATAHSGVSACAISLIPVNSVVTGAAASSSCQSLDYWTFTQAYNGIVVCPFSPVPTGYYKVGTTTGLNCKGSTDPDLILRTS